MTARIVASCFAVAVASAAPMLAPPDAAASDAEMPAIYKCTPANGTVSYQDHPCKGGVIVVIRPGAADPDAVMRLQRAQAADAARRRSDEYIAAARRAVVDLPSPDLSAQNDADVEPYPSFDDFPDYAVYVPSGRESATHRAAHHPRAFRSVPFGRIPATIRRLPRD